MISTRRLRSLGIDVDEYRRSVKIARTRQLMKYGAEQFKEDWNTVIALAQMMAVQGELDHLRTIMEGCFMRIYAWLANNPEDRPW